MTGEIFEVTAAVYNEIVTHAREGKPQEVCGILRGRGAQAFGLVRGQNVARDPVKDYVVDPQTLLCHFDFEEDGDEMVAIYHSHPVSPAYPSASDAWSANYPECAYLICSLEDDRLPAVRAFRMLEHDCSLDPGELRGALDFDETRPGRFGYYHALDAPLPSVLQDACAHIPAPFYVVFESSEGPGKDSEARVVSVTECEIQIVPD